MTVVTVTLKALDRVRFLFYGCLVFPPPDPLDSRFSKTDISNKCQVGLYSTIFGKTRIYTAATNKDFSGSQYVVLIGS